MVLKDKKEISRENHILKGTEGNEEQPSNDIFGYITVSQAKTEGYKTKGHQHDGELCEHTIIC